MTCNQKEGSRDDVANDGEKIEGREKEKKKRSTDLKRELVNNDEEKKRNRKSCESDGEFPFFKEFNLMQDLFREKSDFPIQ